MEWPSTADSLPQEETVSTPVTRRGWALRNCNRLSPRPPDDQNPFLRVSPTLVRGRRPRIDELERLRDEFHIKTMINLEDFITERMWPLDGHPTRRDLQRAAQALGMRMLLLEVPCVAAPRLQTIKQVLDLIDDPALQPVFLFCFKGRERTNFVIAMHRIFREGWSVKAAYDDMMAMGFRRPLVWSLWRQFFAWTRPSPTMAADAAILWSDVEGVAMGARVGAALGQMPSTTTD